MSSSLLLVMLPLSLFVQYAFAYGALAPVRLDGPVVVMDATKRDFGEVFAGEVLEQIFFVRNAGTKPLELKQKSMLGALPAPPRYTLAPALPRPRSQSFMRVTAAMRAAPS